MKKISKVLFVSVLILAFRVSDVQAASGLLVAYPFEAGSGSITADSSGQNNNVTLHGPSWSSSGKYGRALSFDGVNDELSGPNIALPATFTYLAWVKNPTDEPYETIITIGGYRDLYLGNGIISFFDGATDHVFGSKLSNNVWYHVALTYDGANLTAYLNGAATGSVTFSTFYATTAKLQIGAWVGEVGSEDFFSGLIDEVRVYNRVLSASEIQTDMNTAINSPTTSPPPLVSPPSGSGLLFKYSSSPTVYLLENGEKRGIPYFGIYKNAYSGIPIVTISATKTYPDGENLKFPSGSLIKGRGAAVYLIVGDGSKYAFKSADEFFRFGYRFDMVYEVAESHLSLYPNATFPVFYYHATGGLIKYPNSSTVYRIENKTKRGFTSYPAFLANSDSSKIMTISTIFQYPDGPVMTYPDGSLIKGASPAVYLIENQKKRPFSSAGSLLNLGYSFEQVRVVSDSDLRLHEDGEPIQ